MNYIYVFFYNYQNDAEEYCLQQNTNHLIYFLSSLSFISEISLTSKKSLLNV